MMRIAIRQLEPNELLPQIESPDSLPLGLDLLPLDNDWIWLAELDDEPIALLVCGYLHGLLVILRLIVVDGGTPPTLPLLLLRRAFREAKKRGCLGYLSILSDEQEDEVKLMRLAMRDDAVLLPYRGSWVVGRL